MATVHPLTTRLKSFEQRFFIVGGLGLIAALAGAFLSREHFFRAYLMAYLFWTGIGLGCTGILFLHGVTGGNWGLGVRRLLESAAGTLPLLALLFVPILFGIKDLYVWARPEVVAKDHILQHKALYLNVPFMVGRAVVYFGIWIVFSRLAGRWSLQQDADSSTGAARRLRRISGVGIILYVLTMTFAAVDWVMSLEPHWFSTIYGASFVVGQVLSGFAFLIATALLLRRDELRSPGTPVPPAIYDMGNLLMAFVLLWAYFNFSQFLIIWAGNLPEEIPWYLRRLQGGWQYVGLFLILFHFALPFLLLIARATKRSPRLLLWVAVIVVFMRLVDLFWIVSPARDVASVLRFHWLDVAAPIGIGGIWLAVFLGRLKGRWNVPAVDRMRVEVVEHDRA